MSKMLIFLLMVLSFVLMFVYVNLVINSMKDTYEVLLSEREVYIYESIQRNTDLINNIIKN